MSDTARRGVVLVALLVLVVAMLVVYLGWLAETRHRISVGISYFPAGNTESEDLLARGFAALGLPPGWVSEVVPGTPAQDAGIEPFDLILRIEGIPISDVDRLLELERRLEAGDPVTIDFLHDDEERSTEIVLGTALDSWTTIASLLVTPLLALAYLAVSLLVFWLQPSSPSVRVFHWLCVTGAAMFVAWGLWELEASASYGLTPIRAELDMLVLLLVFVILATVLGNFVLHFSLVFPRRRPVLERWPELLYWAHSLPFWPLLVLAVAPVAARAAGREPFVGVAGAALLVVVAGSGLLKAWRRREGWRALGRYPLRLQFLALALVLSATTCSLLLGDPLSTFLRTALIVGCLLFYTGIVLVWSLATCWHFFRSYRMGNLEEKRQVRWPLWGSALVFLLPLILIALLVVFDRLEWASLFDDPAAMAVFNAFFKAAYLLLPLSLIPGILKVRLMEIDFLIGKTVVYTGVSLFVLGGWLVLGGVGSMTLLSWAEIENRSLAVGSTLVLLALFVPVRNFFQRWVDRRFHRALSDRTAARQRLADAASAKGTELESFLSLAAEETQRALGCRSLALFVADESGRLRGRTTLGLPDMLRSRLALPAFEEHPQVFSATEVGGKEGEALRRADAELVARARLAGRSVGAMTVGRRISRRAYDREDELFLAAVADQLALAIRRVEQRGESAEMAQARAIQEALMPSTIARIPGLEVAARWQPAREIGGDAYDVLRFDDHRLGLAIGDVAGKGLTAALLMSGLQAALRAVAGATVEPEEVARQVRRVVCQNLTGGRFVTFFYARIDRASGRLSYVNLGHCPPLLARRSGVVEPLVDGAGVIGRLMADTPIEGGETELAVGDRLLLFTDGVSEARDREGEELGEEKITEWLREHRELTAEALAERLALDVEQFAGGRLHDDLTLVVLAVEPL